MKVAAFLLIPLVLLVIAIQIVNGNPELYKIMPGRLVEGQISDSIRPGVGVEIMEVFTLPQPASDAGLINAVIPYPGRTDQLLYNDMRGTIGLIKRGITRSQPFMDAKKLFGDRFKTGNLEVGLISFAFHPDFLNSGSSGEGKIYTVHSEKPSTAYRDAAYP